MVAVAVLTALPVLVVAREGLSPDPEVWRRLWNGPLPEMILTTLGLLLGVGAGSLVLGVGLAWLVSVYRFPGSGMFEWMLLLPLAMPAYVLGFVFLALFGFAGPVQTGWRALFGPHAWFPEVRSLGGAVFVLSFSLYPYTYLAAKAAIAEHAPSTFEAARLLGDGRLRAGWRVMLPLARPSLAAGAAVAMMETLTDFASVQYFNVQTVSVGVYRIWRGAFDREAAVELAFVVLVFALLVIAAERGLRGRRRFEQRGGGRELRPVTLPGRKGLAAAALCSAVMTLAFFAPVGQLVWWAVGSSSAPRLDRGLVYASNSLGVALTAAAAAVGVAILLAGGARLAGSRVASWATRLATAGYAVPGPVVAIGVLGLVLAAARLFASFGWDDPRVLVGFSLIGLVYAYVVRFTALAFGPVDASLEKITPNVVDAAHTLGAGPTRVLRQIYLPLVRAGAAAGGLLVAVDALKELPIVLLIRPFGFTTLSVWVWELASESRWSMAAIPAMAIVGAAMIPTVVAMRRLRNPRAVPWVS